MMWFNFHTHSHYCDGKESLENILQAAKEQKLVSLGFSSHAPLPFDCKWSMKPEALSSYLEEISRLKSNGEVEVYSGLEVDFIPQQIGPKDFPQLDYTIGSIHFVEQFENGVGWEIDGSHSLFLDGLEKIFKNDIRAAIVRYFELTREMCRTSCPDVIGHLDKIKIQNQGNKFFTESEKWYRDEVFQTLGEISKCGAIVEVNTRGIYQKKSETVYPSPWIIEECFKRNIPITLHSDAHHPADLINYFPEATQIIRQAGYPTISLLTNGSWRLMPFNEHGIEK